MKPYGSVPLKEWLEAAADKGVPAVVPARGGWIGGAVWWRESGLQKIAVSDYPSVRVIAMLEACRVMHRTASEARVAVRIR